MPSLHEMAEGIVLSHASITPMNDDELLQEIQKVYTTLQSLEDGQPVEDAAGIKPTLTAKQSIKANEIICIVCGKGKMKTLTRHLRTAHDMKPGQYKKQFGIPSTQSLAAKSYTESRRKLASENGLLDILAKAREQRAANIKVKKDGPAKPVKLVGWLLLSIPILLITWRWLGSKEKKEL